MVEIHKNCGGWLKSEGDEWVCRSCGERKNKDERRREQIGVSTLNQEESGSKESDGELDDLGDYYG